MWLIHQLAERQILAAIERGELDDLPGAGRPLDLDDDRLIPEHLRAGYRLLRNAGYLPPQLQALHGRHPRPRSELCAYPGRALALDGSRALPARILMPRDGRPPRCECPYAPPGASYGAGGHHEAVR